MADNNVSNKGFKKKTLTERAQAFLAYTATKDMSLSSFAYPEFLDDQDLIQSIEKEFGVNGQHALTHLFNFEKALQNNGLNMPEDIRDDVYKEIIKTLKTQHSDPDTQQARDFLRTLRRDVLQSPEGLKSVEIKFEDYPTEYMKDKVLRQDLEQAFGTKTSPILKLLFSFEKSCAMNGVEVPDNLRPAIYTQLVAELRANQKNMQKIIDTTDNNKRQNINKIKVTENSVMPFTLFQGAGVNTLFHKPEYQDLQEHIPEVFYHAVARYPLTPDLRLQNLIDDAKDIQKDPNLSRLNNYPWAAYWCVFYAAEKDQSKKQAFQNAKLMQSNIANFQDNWEDCPEMITTMDVKQIILHSVKHNTTTNTTINGEALEHRTFKLGDIDEDADLWVNNEFHIPYDLPERRYSENSWSDTMLAHFHRNNTYRKAYQAYLLKENTILKEPIEVVHIEDENAPKFIGSLSDFADDLGDYYEEEQKNRPLPPASDYTPI